MNGIHRDTFSGIIKELLAMDNLVYVCIEQTAAEDFKNAIIRGMPDEGVEVQKERMIAGAHFNFSFSIYNGKLADEVKNILQSLPDGLEIKDYNPEERGDKSARDEATAGYAPMHEYEFKGKGTISGDFDGIINVYQRLQQLPESDVVDVDDIKLKFGD